MLVVPSVDIQGGRCVQLVGGKPETGKTYGDPIEAAINWITQGARYLHLIDLDAAMGKRDNLTKVAEVMANVDVGAEVGGGIRTVERASEIIGLGADRVILGTVAMKDPEVVRKLVELVGGSRIVIALDARGGKVAVEGWRTQTEKDVVEAAREFESLGVGAILFTNVDVEGRMTGVIAEPIRRLVEAVRLPIIAAGGVKSLEDVRTAKEAGAEALVVGTALYEGKFTLKEAMEVAE
ncbi:MAG: 1-(5-phosphoribosyl)-5-[(5-phosphoribosylamino)methylideneamino]imidazole-4-carboxamide isomerase [Candidatus Hadarchaeota archaeon]|nr:1-(5-phosphoribosyl)-5-[(5-phosphoribosylamino)methylideneamino]imidazole-4-carboxamide isomerase [Candidatus Hadarchaeota archaeon]